MLPVEEDKPDGDQSRKASMIKVDCASGYDWTRNS